MSTDAEIKFGALNLLKSKNEFLLTTVISYSELIEKCDALRGRSDIYARALVRQMTDSSIVIKEKRQGEEYFRLA